MKIIKIDGDTATVKAGGLERKANIALLKNVRLGEYILVHAGFAIERVKESEAKKTLKIMHELEM
jgi:hydrogenase expression/formation protein HypC